MKYKNFFASVLLAITLGMASGCATTGSAGSQSGYETSSATQNASGQEAESSDSGDDAETGAGWKILAYVLGFVLGAAAAGG